MALASSEATARSYNANFFWFKSDFISEQTQEKTSSSFFHHNLYNFIFHLATEVAIFILFFFIKSLNLWDLDDSYAELNRKKGKHIKKNHANGIMRHRLHDECAIISVSVFVLLHIEKIPVY